MLCLSLLGLAAVGKVEGSSSPDLLVMMDDTTGACKGCAASPQFSPDDRLIECPNSTTIGATLVVSQSQSIGNAQCRQWVTEPFNCFLTPSDGSWCKWQANVEVVYSQNSCLGATPIYIEGPGIAGRNPLTNSWPGVLLESAAWCSLAEDTTGSSATIAVYHAAAGGAAVAQVTLKVKCTQCKKR